MVREIALILQEVILVVLVVVVESLMVLRIKVVKEQVDKDMMAVKELVHHHPTVELVAVEQEVKVEMETLQALVH